jgi:hypothetical protein
MLSCSTSEVLHPQTEVQQLNFSLFNDSPDCLERNLLQLYQRTCLYLAQRRKNEALAKESTWKNV